MNKLILPLFIIFALSSTSVLSQNSGELSVKTNFFKGMSFYQNYQRITPTKAGQIIRTNPEAFEILQSSNKQAGGATLVSAIGGLLIGWPIGTSIADGDPKWELAAIGAGFTVISAVIYSSAEKKAKKAVTLYNAGLSTSINRTPNTEIRVLAKPTQLGFSISF